MKRWLLTIESSTFSRYYSLRCLIPSIRLQPAGTLKRERIACGIDDPDLDSVVAEARASGKSCHVPGAARILAHIAADARVMAEPVLASHEDGLETRLDELLKALPTGSGDLLDPEAISAMMQAGHDHPDSLHRLVMDLHKRLNAMQAELAEETLDGAAVHGLSESDRPLVAAFMAGVNRTAKLKFNHPGLATTATRTGDRLVIQNDIGTTDAHVILIHVEQLTVSVTYTDVHAERLAFFKDMLQPQAVIWDKESTSVLAAGSAFFMATGHLDTKDTDGCRAYLEFLSSRLVFLIDWNHARKQLREFLRGPNRVDLLSWAAKMEFGYRGFLELGGARLVNQTIEATGTRLNEIRHDLETLFREAEDFEFTVQAGGLFLLQTRRAKRTDWAALAIAVDMVEEGLLTPAEALTRLDGIDLAGVVRTSLAPPVPRTLAVAEVASMGVASGVVALDSAAVKRLSLAGKPAIFVRRETVTSDIDGMALAAGILTASGGRTSHASVVARQLGKVCLVSCPGLEVNLDSRQCTIGGTVLNEGDF